MAEKRATNRRTRHVSKCIFCPATDLTQTHVWPGWLDRLIPPITRQRTLAFSDISSAGAHKESKTWLGSFFDQKPYLCCNNCNTIWTGWFENEMQKFAKPMFTGDREVILNPRQQRVIAVWSALITILAEYTNTFKPGTIVTERDRMFVKERLKPPDAMSIFACSLDASRWTARYTRRSKSILFLDSRHTHERSVRHETHNTQLASFGMGKLFVQAFYCPAPRMVHDFELFNRGIGLTRIWPPETTWLFRQRAPKFPTNLVLDDEQAEIVSNAFYYRIKAADETRIRAGRE